MIEVLFHLRWYLLGLAAFVAVVMLATWLVESGRRCSWCGAAVPLREFADHFFSVHLNDEDY